MTPDDRKLFESLCVAMAGGVLADQGLNPAMVRWGGIADAASDALSAIRAAEGEEAQEPTQSVRTIGGGAGTARDLTAGNTIHALAAKLDAARLAVVLHEQMEAELVSKLDAALSERDQAEAIIHALVDERVQARWDFEALGRVFIRKSVRQDEQDDPKGALDEDELLPLERRILASLGSEGKSASRLWMELEGKVRGSEIDACLSCLEAADYVVFLRGAWRRTAKPVDGEVAGPPKPALLLRSAGWRVEGPHD